MATRAEYNAWMESRIIAVGVALSCSCVQSESVVCGVVVCPATQECAPSGNACASPNWQERKSDWQARLAHAMVYDSVRARTVLYGGRTPTGFSNETWEYDGFSWSQKLPAHAPSARHHAHLAFDVMRARVVLFGGVGEDGAPLSDTWEYDGIDWTQKSVALSPPPRFAGAMAYHAGRQRVVLYGGLSTMPLSDTWEYDGTSWTLRSITSPGPSSFHAMAYDAANDVIVMFSRAAQPETWKYDSTGWAMVTTTSPRGRLVSAMAYDPTSQRVIMIGGAGSQCGGETNCNDAFAFNAATSTWMQISAPFAPAQGGLAFHAATNQLVLVGGLPAGELRASDAVWLREGTDWRRVTNATAPRARLACQLAHLPGFGTVLFGGQTSFPSGASLDDTWVFRDEHWEHLALAVSPPATAYGALALDSRRNKLVLSGTTGDTWEFDGQWSKVGGSGPSPRSLHAMAYDVNRGVMVMHGGWDEVLQDSRVDTWAFDGAWTELTTSNVPPSRNAFGFVYDIARDALVLFGGGTDGFDLTTWELAGSTWTQLAIPGPGDRYASSMTYHEGRQATVLFGGADSMTTRAGSTWEYRNGAWRALEIEGPAARWLHCATYDQSLGQILLFGGGVEGGSIAGADTWTFGYE